MRTLAAACAACVVSGCAMWSNDSAPTTATPVRSAPPKHYQASVADWFDLMTPGPTPQRRLAFGTPETSDCPLFGTGGRHQGWMVPVIYDTSPPGGSGKASTSGTSAAGGKAQATTVKDGQASATLQEVKISGKGYFFWFSSDTIAAVSRRADGCPP